MKIKILCLVVCLLLVFSMFSACSNGNEQNQNNNEQNQNNNEQNQVNNSAANNDNSESSNNSNKQSNNGEKERKMVTFWDYFETDAQRKMMTNVIEKFENHQEDYSAEHVYVPFANFKNQLTVGLQSGELPDLVIIDNPDMASYVQMGLFADITEKIQSIDENEYFSGPMASTKLNNKNYGLPFATNCTCLFYNKDIFDEAGVEYPKEGITWEEFKELAKKVTDESKGITGFGLSAVNSEEGVFQCLPWLHAAGASYLNVDNEGGIETYEFFQDMINEGSLALESISWTQSDVNNQFMSGTIAMQQNGPWQLPGIEQNAPDLNYGITLMPTNEKSVSCLGGENLGVVNGDNVDGAVEFLKFYNQDEIMIETMKDYGSFPPKVEAAQDSYWTNDELQKVFIKQLETSVPRGPSPIWPQISTELAAGFQKAMTNEGTPVEIAIEVQQKLNMLQE